MRAFRLNRKSAYNGLNGFVATPKIKLFVIWKFLLSIFNL